MSPSPQNAVTLVRFVCLPSGSHKRLLAVKRLSPLESQRRSHLVCEQLVEVHYEGQSVANAVEDFVHPLSISHPRTRTKASHLIFLDQTVSCSPRIGVVRDPRNENFAHRLQRVGLITSVAEIERWGLGWRWVTLHRKRKEKRGPISGPLVSFHTYSERRRLWMPSPFA